MSQFNNSVGPVMRAGELAFAVAEAADAGVLEHLFVAVRAAQPHRGGARNAE